MLRSVMASGEERVAKLVAKRTNERRWRRTRVTFDHVYMRKAFGSAEIESQNVSVSSYDLVDSE